MKQASPDQINRRNFLRLSTAGVIGSGLSLGANNYDQPKEPELPKVKDYRTLGRTGFKVSDISIGGTSDFTETMLRNFLKTGMNFIDASPIYGPCERTIGNCLPEFDRKRLFISTKFFPGKGIRKEDVINSLGKSLEAMKTDYVDCLQLQDCLSSEQALDENWLSAAKQLRNEGKVRFIGIACHGSAFVDSPKESMEDVLKKAINSGHYDLVMLVYNFMNYEQGKRIMDECSKKNIATCIMKTNPVVSFEHAKEWDKQYPNNDFIKAVLEKYKNAPVDAETFMKTNNLKDFEELRNAGIRFILDNKDVNTIPLTITNYEDLESYVSLSGQKLTNQDTTLLNDYEKYFGKLYCRHACGICESACPNNVPVNTLLRYGHYYASNKQEARAIRLYNSEKNIKASLCEDCEGFCEKKCPYNVVAQSLLIRTHKELCLG